MGLDISAKWGKPVDLTLGGDGPIYSCPKLEAISNEAGAYVFGRTHGKKSYPLYIGQSSRLRTRISQHLNSAKLMVGLRDAPAGARFVVCCVVAFRRGQNHASVLDVLEDALIAHALSEGNELLQVQGTRFPSHTINFSGNRTSESIAPRFIRSRAS